MEYRSQRENLFGNQKAQRQVSLSVVFVCYVNSL